MQEKELNEKRKELNELRQEESKLESQISSGKSQLDALTNSLQSTKLQISQVNICTKLIVCFQIIKTVSIYYLF